MEAVDEDSPHALLERADDVSVALLKVLEQLGPDKRAAFVLRQLVHRASERERAGRPRFAANPPWRWPSSMPGTGWPAACACRCPRKPLTA